MSWPNALVVIAIIAAAVVLSIAFHSVEWMLLPVVLAFWVVL